MRREAVSAIPGVRLIGTAKEKAGVLSFVIEGVHPHDIGTILDQQGIAIRTGHHCSQPVMERFGIPATARASFAVYNTREGSRRAGSRDRKSAGGVCLMSDLRDLYQDVILEHSKAPRNYRELPAANHKAEGFNPLCGDRFTVYVDARWRCDPRHQLSGLRLRDFEGVGVDDDAEREGQDDGGSGETLRALPRNGHRPRALQAEARPSWASWPCFPASPNFPCA